MNRLLALAVATSLVAAACAGSDAPLTITAPSQKQDTAAPAADAPTPPMPTPPGAALGIVLAKAPTYLPRVPGEPECFRFGTQPVVLDANGVSVIEWRLLNVPLLARIDKGFNSDDAARCRSIGGAVNTSNAKWRYFFDARSIVNGLGTLVAHLDREPGAGGCGSRQPDLDIDRATHIGVVGLYDADCARMPPPPPPPPPPCLSCMCDPKFCPKPEEPKPPKVCGKPDNNPCK